MDIIPFVKIGKMPQVINNFKEVEKEVIIPSSSLNFQLNLIIVQKIYKT